MKKMVAVLLATVLCVPMSLCGCKPRETEPESEFTPPSVDTEASTSDTETSETTEATSETSLDTEDPSSDTSETETAETFLTLESVYVSDCGDEYAGTGYDHIAYHVPQIELESEDAGTINGEIKALVDEYLVADSEEEAAFGYSDYNVYITDSNLMTVVFCLFGWTDDDVFYMWTIDLDSGTRLTNREIADAAGISDVRAAAMYALDRYFEAFNLTASGGVVTEPDFIGGELNPEGPNYDYYTISEEVTEAALNTYSEDTLNEDMMIGLDADSHLIFSSQVVSLGGALAYNQCYSSEGCSIIVGAE